MDPQLIAALAEPNRVRIVELLRSGPRPVGEIAAELNLRQPQVSKHLAALSRAGLVRAHPQANRRLYALEPQAFAALDAWIGSFRMLWEGRLEALDDYLRRVQAEENRKLP